MNSETINRTTPFGLFRYAKAYLEGFEIIWEKKPEFTDLHQVKFYLLCHSLELGFKAYLRSQGYALERLKKPELGHNIDNIVDECFKKGLDKYFTFQNNELAYLKSASRYYSNKEFEYIVIGAKSLPLPDILYKIATRLLKSIKDICTPKKK